MRLYFIILLITLGSFSLSGQTVAVKSNLLYDAMTTLNAGFEFSLAPRWTLDLGAGFNPWKFSEEKQLKHWFVQPELRYWICRKFDGHYLGLNFLYGDYDVMGTSLFEDKRYDGNALGGGLSYGYQWIISPRWSIEASLGLGYLYFEYDKYKFTEEEPEQGRFKNSYIGPTRLGLSIIYFIK